MVATALLVASLGLADSINPVTGLGLDQAAANRVPGELDAAGDAQLLEDVRAVALNRFL